MKLRLLTAVAVVSMGIVACDNAPKNTENEVENQPKNEATAPTQSQEQNQGQQQMADPRNNPGGSVNASDITDQELEQLADLSQQFQQMNQQAQSKMMDEIEKTGMQVQRFTEIQQSQQDPSAELNASEEEMKQFQEANKNLEQVQNNLQDQMIGILEDAGLSEQWYQNITSALRQDKNLLNRYQQIMQKNMPQQQGSPQQGQPQQRAPQQAPN